MEEQVKELNVAGHADAEGLLKLGRWLGRRQAFGMIANRCMAADASASSRCATGISRVSADRLINHLEEFGADYFRLSELMPISRETYRLIAGSVSEQGVEVDGKKIPLTRENRNRVMAAVESLRGRVQAKSSADTVRRRVDAMMAELKTMEPTGSERLTLIGALDEGARKLGGMAHELRAKALSLV
jgi:hypothetical protein